MLAHSIIQPMSDGWLDEVDRCIDTLKPDSWKGYTIGDPIFLTKKGSNWRLDDEKRVYPFYEKCVKSGITTVCIHKGLLPADYEKSWPEIWKHATVWDLGKAAKDWPQITFIIYHSALRPFIELPDASLKQFEDTGRIDWVTDLAEIPQKFGVKNVHAELGTCFANTCVTHPRLAAAMVGTLIKGLGQDKVVWGTDSVWYGSPQWQIEALRRLEIPEDMQKKHGFAPLGRGRRSGQERHLRGQRREALQARAAEAQSTLRRRRDHRHARTLGRQSQQPALWLRGVTMTHPNCSRPTGPSAARPSRTREREYSPFRLRERAASASRAGFTGLGIWHADLAHLRGKHSLAEMKSILDDHGIKHLELEFLLDWFTDGDRRKASDAMRSMLLESAAALGARHIKVGDFFKTPAPMSKLIDEFAQLCGEARDHGTRIVFEFMPFSRIETLPEMIELATGAAQPNGGICVDLWHVVKLGIPYEAVAAIPAALSHVIELNDGYLKAPPGMDLVTETTCHRAFCGEGEFDVRGFVDMMRNVYHGPWGIEALNKAQRAWPLEELTTRAPLPPRAAMFRD